MAFSTATPCGQELRQALMAAWQAPWKNAAQEINNAKRHTSKKKSSTVFFHVQQVVESWFIYLYLIIDSSFLCSMCACFCLPSVCVIYGFIIFSYVMYHAKPPIHRASGLVLGDLILMHRFQQIQRLPVFNVSPAERKCTSSLTYLMILME